MTFLSAVINNTTFMRASLMAAIVAGSVSLSVSSAYADGAIKVMVDRAKVMRVSRPVDTIILGNPFIADAVLKDDKTLVLTGKSFGTTNMIILDQAGEVIADELLSVEASKDLKVTVYRRTDRVTYSCTPTCERSFTLGDSNQAFEDAGNQITTFNDVQ